MSLEPSEDLGTLLHAACRRRDLTVCDVARLADVSSEYMCDIVAGKRPPTLEVAERLVGLLQLNHEETARLMSLSGHGATPPFGVVHPSLVD
jgi:transcriptional regulator with XRE-family HTH domain